jgi:multidrug efflux system membrane fusion protein
VRAAELDVGYCRVSAPFDAYVTNLNIAVGAYARQGQQIFALVDNRAWYVLANFRETYMASIKPGMEAEVYLLTYPGRSFRGVVQGIGWANHPEDGATVGVLPEVRKTLNWVRLANRFPVRILLEDRDAERPFRMGTTAVVTIRGFPSRIAPGAPAR